LINATLPKHPTKPSARGLEVSIDWYLETSGWPDRNAAYIQGACDLFIDAATKALTDAGLDGSDVDTVLPFRRQVSQRLASTRAPRSEWDSATILSVFLCSASAVLEVFRDYR